MAVLTGEADRKDEGAPPAKGAWFALAILFLVYALNFLDRSLIFILFKPIKAEMALGDLELALLGSTSFVLFYTLLGVPFGRIADRVSRTRMIAVGLFIWSLFSGLTGFMHSFTGIFLCRLMVGVGEATLGPAALSLLSDLFPPRMRATVSALYSAGIPLGAGLALWLGGWIADAHGWRWAFYLLGFPGVALALVVLGLPEPARGASERTAAPAPRPGAWRELVGHPVLRRHHLGYALFALAANSVGMWMPTFFANRFSLDLKTVGLYMGLVTVVGGLIGASVGGWGADRFKARAAGGRLRFTALAALVATPLWLAMLFAPSFWIALVPCAALLGVALMWLGPAAADVADIAGAANRGLAVGIYFLVVNIVGYGLGPPLIGWLNDTVGVAAEPSNARFSMLISPLACLGAAAILISAARRMERAQPTP